jgi:hypothetical protein
MQIYAAILLLLSVVIILAESADPFMRPESMISLALHMPLFGRVLGWW